jgi:hypothetical protein
MLVVASPARARMHGLAAQVYRSLVDGMVWAGKPSILLVSRSRGLLVAARCRIKPPQRPTNQHADEGNSERILFLIDNKRFEFLAEVYKRRRQDYYYF